MIEEIPQKKGTIKKIDFLSIIYLLIVYAVTIFIKKDGIAIYILYFILAIPFIKDVDKFAMICFVLSTVSYFFVGADEAIWSIYTILIILTILNLYYRKKIQKSNIIPIVFLVFAVIISYLNSDFLYIKGMYSMIYNMIISVMVCLMIDIRKETVRDFLPMLAGIQIVAFIIILMVNGYYDGYGLTVSESVNHNTFGTAVSILSIILFIKIKSAKTGIIRYRILWLISLILTVASGSRNALMAIVLTTVIMYIILERRRGNKIKGVVKLALIGGIILLLAVIVLPEYGVDLSRYDYVTLISSGGSNRSTIWKKLTPVILEKYLWFGYGPSHYCSTQIMKPLINKTYSHTHNTFFEVWGELGVFGLVPFIALFIYLGIGFIKQLKYENDYVWLAAIFILFIFIGLGESLFANIELWLLIGFCLNCIKKENNKINNKLLKNKN